MISKILTLSILASSALVTTLTFADEVTLYPVVVSSDFRKKLSQTNQSVTVIGEDEIDDKVSQSFAEILGSAVNVNCSAGDSRSKYIQIRGMGQRAKPKTPMITAS